jgi:hypothetical protein
MGDSTGPLRHPGPAAGLTIDGRHGPIWLIVIGSRRSQHTLAQHPCWGPRAVDLCIAGDAGGVGGLHRLTRAIDPSCTRIFVRRVAPNVVGAVVGSRRSCCAHGWYHAVGTTRHGLFELWGAVNCHSRSTTESC